MPLTNHGKDLILSHSLDLLGDTLKVMLLSNQYVPNRDHAFVSDVNYYEVSGAGYVSGFAGAGRKTITGKAVDVDTGADVAYFDFDDVVWTGLLCGTVGYVALIRERTTDADSEVVCIVELATVRVTDGAEWTFQVASPGVFTW